MSTLNYTVNINFNYPTNSYVQVKKDNGFSLSLNTQVSIFHSQSYIRQKHLEECEKIVQVSIFHQLNKHPHSNVLFVLIKHSIQFHTSMSIKLPWTQHNCEYPVHILRLSIQ